MSQDELPQTPLSPENGDLDAKQTAGETSAVAPTARTPRRRRAVATPAVDAVSPSETASLSDNLAESNPAASETVAPKARRAPRRAKVSETETPPVVETSADTPEAEILGVSEIVPVKGRTRRPRRETVSAPTPTESVAETPVVEATAPTPETDELIAPVIPRRGSRARRPKLDPTPTALQATETVSLPDAQLPPTEEIPSRPRRRTRGRKEPETSETLTIAEGVTPIAEGLAISETTIDDVPLPTADGQPLPESETERGSRRRRGGRGRRGRTPNELATEAASETAPVISVNEVEIDDTVNSVALPEATPLLRESLRRGGRGRRGRTGDMPEIPAIVARSTDTETEIVQIAPPPAPYVEPEPVIDLNVGFHLIASGGVAEIHIDGKPVAPVLFFGNLDEQTSRPKVFTEIRHAAKAGIHLHSTLIELPCPLTETSNALDLFDERVRLMLEADPDGFIMPRLLFAPAKGWRREYPTDISLYADGSTGDPALTSERFWAEAERSLNSLVGHVREHSWGTRIFGYHLERGEWFQPADLGYDRSIANRDAFRDWLREKYKDNLVALRSAWYNADVQFHTAEIPAVLPKPDLGRAFYAPRKERPIMDFHEFTSETTATRLAKLAKVIKKATDYNTLVSVCYGYTLEFGHGFSGHLALGSLLKSPHIDLLCGPPSYRDRKPGGAASLPCPTGSITLHGKLWLSEDDTKTYLAANRPEDDAFNPRMPDRLATEEAYARTLGKAFVRNTGVGLMDLWGEGWLDDASLWETFGKFAADFRQVRELQSRRDRAETPDVVVLIDERSLLHVQRGEPFFRRLTNGLRDTLQRAGIRYDIYLQSDLTHPDFPTDAKMYLFATPYRLPIDVRKAITDKLQGGNRTLVWLFAPGTCERRPSFDFGVEEGTGGIIGMTLRPQEYHSEIGSRVVTPNHPIFNKIRGREIGVRERFNPSFYVDDPDAQVLAEYQGSGLGSIGVREHEGWKSVFIGEPILNADLLRGLCRFANVHRWTQYGEDIIEIGNGWILVHAVRDGNKALRLPPRVALYDFTGQKLVADGAREYRFSLRGGHTRLFLSGDSSRFAALGLPNLTPPAGDREFSALNGSQNDSESEAEIEVIDDTEERFPNRFLSRTQPRIETRSEPVESEIERVPTSLPTNTPTNLPTNTPTRKPVYNPPPARPQRSVPLPPTLPVSSTRSIPDEDIATLEAILNMNLDEIESADLTSDFREREVPDAVPVPASNPVSVSASNLLKLEFIEDESELSDDIAEILEDDGNPARRRRRGGRGKGRTRVASINESKDDTLPDGTEGGGEPETEAVEVTETELVIVPFGSDSADPSIELTPRPVDKNAPTGIDSDTPDDSSDNGETNP